MEVIYLHKSRIKTQGTRADFFFIIKSYWLLRQRDEGPPLLKLMVPTSGLEASRGRSSEPRCPSPRTLTPVPRKNIILFGNKGIMMFSKGTSKAFSPYTIFRPQYHKHRKWLYLLRYFIKWTKSGKPLVDLKSHGHFNFWSNKQLISDHQRKKTL